MKKSIILSSLLIVTWLPATAQRLVVTKPTVNCGTVAFDKPVTAKFELKNKGNKKLKIVDVKTSCGCTAADYPREDIHAGATFELHLTYDARQLGHFDKSVCIISNGSKTPVYLNMKGIVMAELQDYTGSYPFAFGDLMFDRNAVEFDDVNKGEMPMQEIYVLNAGTTVFNPTMMHLPPYLSATVTPSKISPGRSGRSVLTLNSAKLRDYGLTQTSIYLARNLGETISADNEITVSAVLLPGFVGLTESQKQYTPKLVLSSDSLDIDFEGKAKKSAEILVTNNGRTDLKISSLQMFTGGLKVTLGKRELKPGESTKMKITAMRNELKKQRTKPRVLMITNDPDRSKVVIKINSKTL